MVEIDWGDVTPTHGQRARVLARVAELGHLDGSVVALRRCGERYEAALTTSLAAPAEVRLAGEDLASVVHRACELLSMVAGDADEG